MANRVFSILCCIAMAGLSPAFARQKLEFNSPKVELKQTGIPSQLSCGSNESVVAAYDAVAKVGGAAIDAYLASSDYKGANMQGIGSALVGMVANQANVAWLHARLFGTTGSATCATQCVVVPKNVDSRLSVLGCLSETGGDGLDCGVSGWNGEWRGVDSVSRSETSAGVLYCLRGKNSSHNRNRYFWVTATDRNPMNGAELKPPVGRP